jgi:hypothetical protein
MDHRAQFHLNLRSQECAQAALQSLQLASQADWALLVEFALAVVLLQEEVASASEYHLVQRQK